MKVTAGDETVIIEDNDINDNDPTPGMIVYFGFAGGFDVYVDTGISMGPANTPYLDLNSFVQGGPGVLTVEFSDVDWGPVAHPTFEAQVGGNSDGTFFYETFLDSGNTHFGHGTPLTTIGPLSGDPIVKVEQAPSGFPKGPFSLTLKTVVTHISSTQATGYDADIRVVGDPRPPQATIGNFVWNDLNVNGVQDANEPGVSGVTVNLYSCADSVRVADTVTDANGFYEFSVSAGDYFVEFLNLPAGFVFTSSTPGTDSDETDSDANPSTGLTDCTTLVAGETDLTWDAGIYRPAQIGDYVWHDLNRNGEQDPDEPGVPNVTVELRRCADDSMVATTATDIAGTYGFTVPAGSYYVQFQLPAGFEFTNKDDSSSSDDRDSDADPITGKTDCTDLASGEKDLSWDAGLRLPVARIGNFVWDDLNGNGIQDGGEPGVPNVQVKLHVCGSDDSLMDTVTDVNGYYAFIVAPGSYYVEFRGIPAGYIFSPSTPGVDSDETDSDANPATGKTDCTVLTGGEADLTWDAGIYRPSRIGDYVWEDMNGNGKQDGGEPGVPEIAVTLYRCVDNAVVATTTTDADGLYGFTVVPGDYYVGFDLPAGFQFTIRDAAGVTDDRDSDVNPATGKADCTTLTPGESDTTWDAGILRRGALGDFVWNDTDRDGIQDANETGVSGITVELLDCLENVLATATTDAAGKYLFSNLLPGSYKVRFVLPPDYFVSPMDQGANDAVDSDVDGNGRTGCIDLPSGQTNLTIDAGIFPKKAAIGDRVWDDLNANGIQDAGEPGVGGVTVQLYRCDNTLVSTTTTSASGIYSFTGLTPGDYYVKFSNLPAGYVFSPSTASGASDPNDSDANTTTGVTACTTLAGDETDLTWDAGINKPDICVTRTFSFGGSSYLDGQNGNIRQYTVNGVNVRVSAFSRSSSGSWASAYLGAYPGGLGVTDSGEGDGGGNRHTVDNIDRNNYVLFEFSQPVVLSRAYLGYVVGDSDLSVRIGTFNNPYNNHITLNESVFNSFAYFEHNDTTATGPRWAFVNGGEVSGNAIIIAASLTDSSPDDQFKIEKVEVCVPQTPPPPANASIGDRVWDDKNGNGVQDANEPGVDGVKVELYRCDNTLVASTTSANDGTYGFTVPPGDYYVKFSNLPAGYQFSPSTPGSASDSNDSDANPSSGKTDCTSLVSGENDKTWDAGINKPFECVQSILSFDGSTAFCGTAGNIRTFSINGVSVRVSAFSRTSGGSWNAAYLGVYPGGLGVTDSGEGDGGNNRHTVDNIDRNNYVLFEFSQPVVVTRAYLGYVVNDSDLSVRIGNFNDPYNNHITLNDSTISSFGPVENSDTASSGARWASFNGGEVVGNALIIAASLTDSARNDQFKIDALDICAPEINSCPAPYGTGDIGTVAKAGSVSYNNNTRAFTIKGSGADIWGTSDAFRYAYIQASGDCTVAARVTGVSNTDPWAKAGVMIRENLNANARHASTFVTPANGVAFQYRNATGGSSGNVNTAPIGTPYWVAVTRSGNTFTSYRSTNGSDWVVVGSQTISMGSSVYIGLAVTSHDDTELCTATFDNVYAAP